MASTRQQRRPGRQLGTREVAAKLGVSEWTLRDWAKRGIGPKAQRSATNRHQWDEHDIDDYLAARRPSCA